MIALLRTLLASASILMTAGTLASLQRLPAIGSDHFPIFIELLYDPQAATEQPETEKKPGDEEEAEERLRKQAEVAATGDDRPKDA